MACRVSPANVKQWYRQSKQPCLAVLGRLIGDLLHVVIESAALPPFRRHANKLRAPASNKTTLTQIRGYGLVISTFRETCGCSGLT